MAEEDIIDATAPTFFDDSSNENNYVTYIVIILIILTGLYFLSSPGFPSGDDPLKAIETTHKTCPVMSGSTTISTCVQYPEMNKGFIVSVCCKECIGKLQTSFNNRDGEYTIKEENGMNILYHNNTPKQVTPLCNEENMKLVIELANTQVLNN